MWYGDPSFSAEQRREIERGAEWLYAQAGLPAPRIEWATPEDDEAATIRPLEIAPGYDPDNKIGLAEWRTVYVTPAGEMLPRLAWLTAHEMAHAALHFDDRPGEDGLMGASQEALRWTESEREQCRRSPVCVSD